MYRRVERELDAELMAQLAARDAEAKRAAALAGRRAASAHVRCRPRAGSGALARRHLRPIRCRRGRSGAAPGRGPGCRPRDRCPKLSRPGRRRCGDARGRGARGRGARGRRPHPTEPDHHGGARARTPAQAQPRAAVPPRRGGRPRTRRPSRRLAAAQRREHLRPRRGRGRSDARRPLGPHGNKRITPSSGSSRTRPMRPPPTTVDETVPLGHPAGRSKAASGRPRRRRATCRRRRHADEEAALQAAGPRRRPRDPGDRARWRAGWVVEGRRRCARGPPPDATRLGVERGPPGLSRAIWDDATAGYPGRASPHDQPRRHRRRGEGLRRPARSSGPSTAA